MKRYEKILKKFFKRLATFLYVFYTLFIYLGVILSGFGVWYILVSNGASVQKAISYAIGLPIAMIVSMYFKKNLLRLIYQNEQRKS